MKFLQKSSLELGEIVLPDLFVLNYMNQLEGIDIKIYLYILFLSKKGIEIEKNDLAKKLNITDQELSFGLERLQAEELLVRTTHGYNIVDIRTNEINKTHILKVEPKRTRSQTEKERKRIAAASAINESFFQGVMSLGWYTDISAMFENYSFSEEVMIALFHYCQERKALNKKYVHAVAESWFNGGVKSFEQLEEFLENYDNVQKIKQKITKALRLNRNLTKYEEQYIDTWIKDFQYNFDVIEEALKRTVNKPNPTLSYVNGILVNWYKKGYKTVKDIEKENNSANDELITRKHKKIQDVKTKYQDVNQREYTNLESFYDNM